MRWQLIPLLLIFSNVAFGSPSDPPANWSASCHSDDGDFQLYFRSASGNAFEDDEAISLQLNGKMVNFPLKPALYELRTTLGNVKNLCDNVAALDVGQGKILFLLSKNGRPSWPYLDAALVDIKKMIILDVKPYIGEIKTRDDVFPMRRVKQGSFDVRVIREYIKDSECDCEAAAIEDWLRISIDKTKIKSKWVRP